MLQRALFLAAVSMLVVLLAVSPAFAAVPRIVMVYGPPLEQPVVMTDWPENGWVVSGQELPTTALDTLEGRPFLEVVLFWGPAWDEYVRVGKPIGTLRPEQGNAVGRLYPAMGQAPAICVCAGLAVRRLGPEALAYLERQGVPVRLDQPAGGELSAGQALRGPSAHRLQIGRAHV